MAASLGFGRREESPSSAKRALRQAQARLWFAGLSRPRRSKLMIAVHAVALVPRAPRSLMGTSVI